MLPKSESDINNTKFNPRNALIDLDIIINKINY